VTAVATRRAIDQIIPPDYQHHKESSVNRSLRLVAALGMLALPSLAQAQVTGSITASATIATVFAFGAPTALNFGSITPNTAVSATGSIPMQRNIGVIYSLPDGATTGVLTSGGNTLQPTYTCGVGSTGTAIVTAFSSCTSTASVMTVSNPGGLVNEFVVFKADLSAAQTGAALPGVYTGTIRVLASPN
jgi:hypothetical protein